MRFLLLVFFICGCGILPPTKEEIQNDRIHVLENAVSILQSRVWYLECQRLATIEPLRVGQTVYSAEYEVPYRVIDVRAGFQLRDSVNDKITGELFKSLEELDKYLKSNNYSRCRSH